MTSGRVVFSLLFSERKWLFEGEVGRRNQNAKYLGKRKIDDFKISKFQSSESVFDVLVRSARCGSSKFI